MKRKGEKAISISYMEEADVVHLLCSLGELESFISVAEERVMQALVFVKSDVEEQRELSCVTGRLSRG